MVKQMRSAERMREVQPKIKALQERYADDKQKQSEEMMKFYREENINPLGGCLPLALPDACLDRAFLRASHFDWASACTLDSLD